MRHKDINIHGVCQSILNSSDEGLWILDLKGRILNVNNDFLQNDRFNARLIKEILKNKDLNIFFADNGAEAVELAAGIVPDLILMDIGLLDMSGYEAISLILKNNPRMKIVAHSAYAATSDKEQSIRLGCIDHIGKPIKPATLLSLLDKYLSAK